MHQYIKSKINNNRRYYILLDEIQEVSSWEKAINSFRVNFDTDIYITGSNSRLLSSELATYLAGRYIEIPVYTLSFREYLQFRLEYARVNEPELPERSRGCIHYIPNVVTMEENWHDNIEGIQHKHIADFILMKEY